MPLSIPCSFVAMVLLLGERFGPGKSVYKADLVEDINQFRGKSSSA